MSIKLIVELDSRISGETTITEMEKETTSKMLTHVTKRMSGVAWRYKMAYGNIGFRRCRVEIDGTPIDAIDLPTSQLWIDDKWLRKTWDEQSQNLIDMVLSGQYIDDDLDESGNPWWLFS